MSTNNRYINIIRLIILISLIALTIVILLNRNNIQRFSDFGYLGVFILSVLSNATIIFPIPGVVFTSAMGAVFNPFWVALAAGCGATLGELTGYLAGFSGQFIVDKREWYQKVKGWMEKFGNLTVLVMAFIPNPLFDLTGIAAGVLKMPLVQFIFWCLLGKILKMLVFAYTGDSVFGFFE